MLNKKNIIRVWHWASYFEKLRLEKEFPWITKEGLTLDPKDQEDDDEPYPEEEYEEPILSLHEKEIILANKRREDEYKDG